MTFSPIHNWSIGEELTSVQMNAIGGNSGDLPKALDKTGDGYADAGGITGTVDVVSGGSLRLVSSGGAVYATLSGSTFNTKTGSTFLADSGSTVTLNGTTTLSGNTTTIDGLDLNIASQVAFTSGYIQIQSEVLYAVTNVAASGASYTVDSGGYSDYFIFINTSTTAKTISIGNASLVKGRSIVIMDATGNASSNNITIQATGGSQIVTASGTASTWVLSSAWVKTTIVSNGTNWYISTYVSGV